MTSSPIGGGTGPGIEAGQRVSAILAWLVALAVLGAVTGLLLLVRAHLDKAHVALAYLVVVLVGSAAGGRAVGLTLAALAFLAFDYWFLPPYYTLILQNPLDWLVLAAFFVTSAIAAQLLDRAQTRAEVARRRAVEVERLSMLGAETLNAGGAEDALAAIAEVIRSALGVDCCEIYLAEADDRGATTGLALGARAGVRCEAGPAVARDADAPAKPVERDSLTAWVGTHGLPATEHEDRTTHVAPHSPPGLGFAAGVMPWQVGEDVRAILAPLLVRGRTVGVLRVAHAQPIVLEEDQRQFLDALSYYAALGAERVRLVAAAEHTEALRHADKLKSALLAAVSHDLRTPLTTIKALAHAVASEGDPGSRARARSIEEEADRLNRTVADLLDLSRLGAGALTVQPELNALEDLIGATLQRVSGIAGGHEIFVNRGVTAPLLLGRFDFVHALRALGNLVENALKYSPHSAPVELSVEREGDVLRIAVADRGPGIAPGDEDRIFEPFYRPERARPDAGGAGLGLAIASRLADAQNGRVYYEPRPGGGSIFVLELPASDPPAELLDVDAEPIFTRS